MKASPKALAQAMLLVAILLTAVAFVVSFVRGFRAAGPDGHTRTETTPWTVPANVDTRMTGRVEVLNGAGRAGLAREATRMLRDAGLDVVYFGNASAADTSVVLHRGGSIELAQSAAEALGIRRVITREDSTLFVDVTVILGADWRPATRRD